MHIICTIAQLEKSIGQVDCYMLHVSYIVACKTSMLKGAVGGILQATKGGGFLCVTLCWPEEVAGIDLYRISELVMR